MRVADHPAAHVTEAGFVAAARVVVTAAVIMIAIFAAFVPHGTAIIKPIAFSLAVGVLIDAFAVRMTLVPAVLALLGDRAWRLPARPPARPPASSASPCRPRRPGSTRRGSRS